LILKDKIALNKSYCWVVSTMKLCYTHFRLFI